MPKQSIVARILKSDLGKSEKLVLIAVAKLKPSRHSQDRLAKLASLNRSTINQILTGLRKKGVILAHVSTQYRGHVYRIIVKALAASPTPAPATEADRAAQGSPETEAASAAV